MSDYTFLEPTQEAANVLSKAKYARVEELARCIDADVESWFTSSVACCDACIDEYIAAWPNAYQHDESFQDNVLGFSTFYEGSFRVRKRFSEAEFDELLPYIACPRCLQSIGCNLYPYELPFDIPEDWEAKQRSLAERAASTPFLLLREPFAKEIHDNLNSVCSDLKPSDISIDLFRGRHCPAPPQDEDFFPPPPEKTREGRYNHSGIPVLYLATNRLTCWRECRAPDSNFYVGQISIRKVVKVIDLAQSDGLAPILQALIFSSLMSAPSLDDTGWHQPQYVLTRFVADCVKGAGVNGIMYPSVRCGAGNNLAILDVKDCGTWLHVSDVEEYRSGKQS